MDAVQAAAIMAEANEFQTVRSPDWQGPQARSGPLYEPEPTPVSTCAASDRDTPAPQPQSQSLWHVLEAAVGGGQQGKLVSRLLQKHLLARVDALPIDAIELMAGDAASATGKP